MTNPVKTEVDDVTKDALMSLSAGDMDLLAEGLEYREEWRRKSGVDARSYAMVKIAALVALDAPPASYEWPGADARASPASPRRPRPPSRPPESGRRSGRAPAASRRSARWRLPSGPPSRSPSTAPARRS